jgi:hypothetical protein
MNWALMIKLSGFGLAMGLLTVAIIPSSVEPFVWLPIFVFCAYAIARQHGSRHFVHGLCVSLVNCVWITGAHIAFAATYLANHPDEAAMLASMPMPDSPRLMMLMTGPVIGVISGIVLGGFAWIAGKFVKRAVPA